jgi:hypothetical protein
MQDAIHIIKPNGEPLLLLRRAAKYGIKVKIRKTGQLGKRMEAEEQHLHEHPHLITAIEAGVVVYL